MQKINVFAYIISGWLVLFTSAYPFTAWAQRSKPTYNAQKKVCDSKSVAVQTAQCNKKALHAAPKEIHETRVKSRTKSVTQKAKTYACQIAKQMTNRGRALKNWLWGVGSVQDHYLRRVTTMSLVAMGVSETVSRVYGGQSASDVIQAEQSQSKVIGRQSDIAGVGSVAGNATVEQNSKQLPSARVVSDSRDSECKQEVEQHITQVPELPESEIAGKSVRVDTSHETEWKETANSESELQAPFLIIPDSVVVDASTQNNIPNNTSHQDSKNQAENGKPQIVRLVVGPFTDPDQFTIWNVDGLLPKWVSEILAQTTDRSSADNESSVDVEREQK